MPHWASTRCCHSVGQTIQMLARASAIGHFAPHRVGCPEAFYTPRGGSGGRRAELALTSPITPTTADDSSREEHRQ